MHDSSESHSNHRRPHNNVLTGNNKHKEDEYETNTQKIVIFAPEMYKVGVSV